MKKLSTKHIMFIVLLIAAIAGLISWQIINCNSEDFDIVSKNPISFGHNNIYSISSEYIINEVQNSENKNPVLIYFYSTWCGACSKQFKDINQIARNFQETNLKIFIIAIDKDISTSKLSQHLSKNGDIYFKPYYLVSKEGLRHFFFLKKINYQGSIPFFMLFDKNGRVYWQSSGKTSYRSINNKLINVIDFMNVK